jgi:hypothetical protein
VLPTLIELVLAPMLAAAATLAARRWGPRTGGVVSAFPAIVGPVLLITALQHGAPFAARAANGTLLGLVALGGFAFAYGTAATRGGWPISLLAGWVAAAVAALAVGRLAGGAGPPAGLLVAVVSLAVAHRGLRPDARTGAGHRGGGGRAGGPLDAAAPARRAGAGRGGGPLDPTAPARHDLPARMGLTAVLVFTLATAAGALGPLVGGMLAALPVLASLLAVFTHRRDGGTAAALLLRGTLAGMAGFVAFVEVVALLLVPTGTAPAFLAATLAAVAVQALAVWPPRGRGWRRVTPREAVAVGAAATPPEAVAVGPVGRAR